MAFSSLSRVVRNSPLSWPIRMSRQATSAAWESQYVSRVARLSDTSTLESRAGELLRAISSVDEVFLLGSGSSVLDVPPNVWDRISSQISIGFGPWALHSFVPDVYAYGPTRGLRDYNRVVREVMNRSDIVEKKPDVLFLRSDLPEDIQTIKSLPEPHRSQTYIYGRVSPMSDSRAEIFREMRHWHLDASNIRNCIAFDSGSTLVRLISLLMLLRAKKIILVGVDLNTVEYFWERAPHFLTNNGFESFETGQSGRVHDTLLPSNRPSGVVPLIEDMRRLATEDLDCEIEVVSARSALASVIPLYTPHC